MVRRRGEEEGGKSVVRGGSGSGQPPAIGWCFGFERELLFFVVLTPRSPGRGDEAVFLVLDCGELGVFGWFRGGVKL